MFFDDHEPAHFHAEFQGENATFDFSGRVISGRIRSTTARRLVRQWARLHGPELELNWKRSKRLEPLEQVPPLE